MLIPKNRHEYYLAVISGNDYPTFPPKTREELYLAKLAGREVDVPIPKTPKERAYYNIINDIKFEPENRWQTFVAAANDDSITAPIPRTREEIWWSNISLSHEVIVEYVGTLPATLQTVAGYLESYKIYGNTVQDGTPTPENPIMPSGCGVRTENLCDENNINQGYYAYADGQYVNIGTWVNTYYIAIKGGTEYTVKFKTIYDTSRWYGFVWYDKNKQYISTTNTQDNPSGCELTAISPANASFCVFNICSRSVTDVLSRPDVIYVMLAEGSTALR